MTTGVLGALGNVDVSGDLKNPTLGFFGDSIFSSALHVALPFTEDATHV